jgi:hypothetical protein
MDSIQPGVTGKKVFSISEFCRAHGIGRSSYYNLKKAGRAPVEMTVLSRKMISEEAAAAWRRQMEVA